jgi:sugar/nucleoside kinase (ribokinase family)
MTPDALCIGAALWDVIGRSPVALARGDDRPGPIRRAPGGVALNVARALARMGLRPALLGAVGDDSAGRDLIAACAGTGIEGATLTVIRGQPTDRYLAIEDPDGLVAAVADAATLEAAGAAILSPLSDGRLPASWSGPAVVDGNLTEALLADLATDPRLAQADLRLVPASPGKALRLAPLMRRPGAALYLNRIEAGLILGSALPDAASAAAALVAAGAARVLVTDGAAGAADAARGLPTLACPAPPVAIARVTGAGDTFLAAHLAAELRGADRASALTRATTTAARFVAGEDPAS